MKIEFTHSAQKQLSKLPKNQAKKIIKKIKLLSLNFGYGKKLKGNLSNKYSLRAWPYRIIYTIIKNTIYIETIAHRQSVYK